MTKTPQEFTKYERARIIGARALQLSMDAPLLLKVPEKELDVFNYDALRLAEKELDSGVLPISINRPLPIKREEKLKEIKIEELEKEEKEGEETEAEKEQKEEQAEENAEIVQEEKAAEVADIKTEEEVEEEVEDAGEDSGSGDGEDMGGED
ncbi:DNA-directed RNA polymerase subunit K [uncultured archaeon]|nr:DNA-directed RNA polymerase subunit K [uncultured archaeon]